VEFPRVLIISPTRLDAQTATGAAMASFFRGWPKDRIAQIYSNKVSEFDHGVCEQYCYANSHLEKIPGVKKFGRITTELLGCHAVDRIRIRWNDVLAWARRFRPEVVYYRAVEDPSFFKWLPLRLTKELGVPLVTHIMDDWPARCEARCGAAKRRFLVPRLHRQLEDLFQNSVLNLSICEKMSRAFQDRYGVRFIPFHNSIDIDEWKDPRARPCQDASGPFRIVYTGSLASDMQLWSVKDLAEVVGELHKGGVHVGLELYGAKWWLTNYGRYLEGLPGVKHMGFVPSNEYPRILMEADLLALPINFDDESLAYIRYSMANKGPDYMASGTPILVYGPAESATVEYAASAGWGYVVAERDKEKLEKAVLDLMSDRERGFQLGQHARTLAFKKHDARIVRKRFQALLRKAADGGLTAVGGNWT
jgi:glycosyltransferase involved in cell wall biosynthesis